jgi:hypothetical protein
MRFEITYSPHERGQNRSRFEGPEKIERRKRSKVGNGPVLRIEWSQPLFSAKGAEIPDSVRVRGLQDLLTPGFKGRRVSFAC